MTAKLYHLRDHHKRRTMSHRAAIVNAMIVRRPMLKRESERLMVATNLWKILSRIEQEHAITKAGILHEAGHGRPEESTKRLPRFAVNPSLDDNTQRQRAKKLTQKAERYIGIVRTAARLSGLSEDDLIAELFAGTSYEEGTPDFPEHIFEMVGVLHRMARWVIEESDLDIYWDCVKSVRGSYDPRNGRFIDSANPLLVSPDLAGSLDYVDEAPPVPEVRLLSYTEKSRGARLKVEGLEGSQEDVGEVNASMHRELRLCIGPADGTLKPLFAIHSELVISEKGGRELARISYTDGTDASFEILISGQKQKCLLDYGEINGDPFPHSAPFPFAEFVNGTEPWYIVYLPVTPATVSEYLSMKINGSLLFATGYPNPGGLASWQAGTLGDAIESNLLYAPEGKIDDCLVSDAVRKHELLNEYVEDMAVRRNAAIQVMDEKWNSIGIVS